ncbi:MAG TPA: RNA polymerase sigma factor [Patescibacteria group bacterium]
MNKINQKVKVAGDNSLISLIKDGHPEIYDEIVRRYEKKLFSYIYRLVGNKEEAEDILQNVFVKTYRNIKTFDIERKFSSWIYRIAHNEAINFLKKRNKKKFVSWEDIVASKDKMETKSNERSPIDIWIRKESAMEVNQAMDRLPEKYRKVLMLKYFSEKSYEEISKTIGSPVNTVGTLISRAKKKLMTVINLMER